MKKHTTRRTLSLLFAAIMSVGVMASSALAGGGHDMATGEVWWTANGQVRHAVFNAHDDAPTAGGTEDRGDLYYENVTAGWWFKADVTAADVDPSSGEAWFSTTVTAASANIPAFLAVDEVWEWDVVDNGEPGAGYDTWTATYGGTTFATFTIEAGNLQVQ